MQRLAKILAACFLLLLGGIAISQNPDPTAMRRDAERLQQEGNFKEAFDLYKKLLAIPSQSGPVVAKDLENAFVCMQRLRLFSEADGVLHLAMKVHGDHWQVAEQAATRISSIPHQGVVQGKTFTRAPQRGDITGMYVNRQEQDRQQALQWLARGLTQVEKEPASPEVAKYYARLASTLMHIRQARHAWLLQEKTNLEGAIDYADLEAPSSHPTRFAPVDESGKPILYPLPKTWADASSDGERYRWALEQSKEMNAAIGLQSRLDWARFLNSQFSVDTLVESRWFLNAQNDEDQDDKKNAVFAIHTLSDDEAIAKLASGIQRFTLDAEFNPIRIFQELARSNDATIAESALWELSQIHLNRRQYPKALEELKTSLQKFGNKNQSKIQLIASIEEPRGAFDPVPTQLAGSPATLGLVFRNGKVANLQAHRVDLEAVIAATKSYYQTVTIGSNQGFDGNPNKGVPDIRFPYSLFDDIKPGKYASNHVASWTEKLEPRENHWDRRITLKTPLQEAGLYVVTLRFDGSSSNVARCLVWIQDTAILRKPLDQKHLYYVADAKHGLPQAGWNVEFFGIRHNNNSGNQRGQKVWNTTNFSKKTDNQGQLLLSPEQEQTTYQWMVIARDGKGKLATLGTEWVGLMSRHFEQWNQLKAYGVSDRPVYKPGDKAHLKLWIARAAYAPDVASTPLPSQAFKIRVADSQGTVALEKSITTDKFGGIELDFETTKKSTLGLYHVQVLADQDQWIECPLQFRVEEYRKPEFEVDVIAPDKPVALGETIRSTIRAKYYFGSPVTDATATIRVQRTAYQDTYYPVFPYDWCYGPGYWWQAYDYSWYPGWGRWVGCVRPLPWWIGGGNYEPPELVLEKQVKLDASGEAKIEIDTAIAKALQGKQDHRYSITVEVRDASRRTIDASGQVIAARNPFKIYTWLDRGFYRTGNKIMAHFQAKTPSGSPVAGKGRIELLRIQYNDKKEPQEKLVQSWDATTDADGLINHAFQAGEGGQYRLRLVLTDEAQHEVEGAFIFTVHGDRATDAQFRFNKIELITDKADYQPGEKIQLQINADHEDAHVLLFVRPANGVYPAPQAIRLKGKSTIVEIPVEKGDQPNFFIEAVTVYDCDVHTASKEIIVPPENRVLEVKASLDQKEYLPGQEAKVNIEVKDPQGKPVEASTVIAIYDRSIDAISGGIAPSDIREFFWKWRRHYVAQMADNLTADTYPITIHKVTAWSPLGIFGRDVSDPNQVFLSKGGAVRMMRGGGPGGMEGMAADMAMPAPAMAAEGAMGGMGGAMAKGMNMLSESLATPDANAAQAMPEPSVRKDFADTALWVGLLETDAQGRATRSFKMPESLTSWKIRTWSMGDRTRVGSDSIEVKTRKNLMARLQAPRFLVERDECVVSTLVNNDFAEAVEVQVQLQIDGELNLKLKAGEAATQTVTIGAKEQKRIDWRCIAIAEGEAKLRTIAKSAKESDAMELKIPIVVNGILKTDSLAGTIRPNQNLGTATFRIPEARREEQSVFTLRVSPSLAMAMVDALPYMVDYPYGCTEQTLNRFVPTVITQKVLQDLRIDLKKVAEHRNNLNAQELGDATQRKSQWKRFGRNPVFDADEVQAMVDSGLRRLTDMQCSDGGWGWFSGAQEHSWPHTTATVVRGLMAAQHNDMPIVPGVLERGLQWLENYQAEQLQWLKNFEKENSGPSKSQPDQLDALVFSILAESGKVNAEMQKQLYNKRQSQGVYGMTLIAIGTHHAGNVEQTQMLRRNIEQYLVEDQENETAHLRNEASWWYWYGSDIEANATYLKLLSKLDPKGATAPRIVKYLLNNRKHATYWNSTRDSAYVIEAFADYIRASGEIAGSVGAEVYLDGAKLGSIEFTPETLFLTDNTIRLFGKAIPSGEHRLEIRKKGDGPLYWNAYSTNFTLEEEIAAAGLEVKVERTYYLLTPQAKSQTLAGDRGQILNKQRLGFDRTKIEDLSEVKSGSMVEVELIVESKNDYEYIMVEDNKPATLEPIDFLSGYTFDGGLSIYREFREQKVGFFLRVLPQGKHSIRYRLRAEAPGTFTALPSVITGMYAPELVGNSTDFDIKTVD